MGKVIHWLCTAVSIVEMISNLCLRRIWFDPNGRWWADNKFILERTSISISQHHHHPPTDPAALMQLPNTPKKPSHLIWPPFLYLAVATSKFVSAYPMSKVSNKKWENYSVSKKESIFESSISNVYVDYCDIVTKTEQFWREHFLSYLFGKNSNQQRKATPKQNKPRDAWDLQSKP